MSLGRRVQDRMVEKGLSQAELARRVGLSQPSIYALIHKNKTGTRNLHLIARELGTTSAYLAGETDDPDADAPDPPRLSYDALEMVDLMDRLEAADIAALLQIARTMANKGSPQRLHAQPVGFRAGKADDHKK